MVVVDTSVWVDFLRGIDNDETEALTSLIATGQDVALTALTFTELLQGTRSEREAAMLADYLRAFRIEYPKGLNDFDLAAKMFRDTRAHGKTVRKTIDCLIAAICVRTGAELLHRDVDFDLIAGVSPLQVFRFSV